MSRSDRFVMFHWRSAAWLYLIMLISLPLQAATDIHYAIKVTIDPSSRMLSGKSQITLPSTGEFELVLSHRFTVSHLQVNGARVMRQATGSGGMQSWRVTIATTEKTEQPEITLHWQGELAELDQNLDHAQTLGRPIPVSGHAGTFLPNSSAWYPAISGALARYQVELALPFGQRGLVAGRRVQESESEADGYHARFVFEHPSDGIDLMAGPYQISKSTIRSAISTKEIQLNTYFHPEISNLAGDYLDSVKQYIAFYEQWIGEYPFTEFSVVSSPTPTGFGMPTLTYLGVNVLKLPFIRATSLGHEVLHNWWGNSVYADYSRGNWSEGLTTFMADYTYKAQQSSEAAREMRLDWLRDFTALAPGQDQPLLAFTSRTHGASKIVGYNKAAMFFLMLRDWLGEAVFDQAIRKLWREQRFHITAWQDIQRIFEQVANRSLDAYFRQWLTLTGAPEIKVTQAISDTSSDGQHRLTVVLTQSDDAYQLRVPLLIRDQFGIEEKRYADLQSTQQAFEWILPSLPDEIVLDPDFQLFRLLATEEAVPILREGMVNRSARTLLLSRPDSENFRIASTLIGNLQGHQPLLVSKQIDFNQTPLIVAGLTRQVSDWLMQRNLPAMPQAIQNEKATAYVWTMRSSDGAVITILSARDNDSLRALGRTLPHYGRQSYLVYDGATVIEKGVWPAQTPVIKVQANRN